LGKDTQQVIGAVKRGDWAVTGDVVRAGTFELVDGEYELRLSAKNLASDSVVTSTLPGGAGIVLLDIELTPELIAEGVARDVVRAVQQARRDAGLAVSDRISLVLGLPAAMTEQVRPFLSYVAAETLAESVSQVDVATVSPNTEVDGVAVHVSVDRLR
jgi:isoleucyl-tRNA synthetase